jgi:integrase
METAINGMHKRWYGKTKEHKRIQNEAKMLREAGKEEEAKAKEGEIPPWIEFTVVPYDLRHSFCTMCRDNGVELHTCIEWMGHADATMIMKIYDEVSDNRSKTEAERLKKTLFHGQNDGQNQKDDAEPVENKGSENL